MVSAVRLSSGRFPGPMPTDIGSAYAILDAGTGSHSATAAMLRDQRWPRADLAGPNISSSRPVPGQITRVDAIAGNLPGMGLPSLRLPSIGSIDVERLASGALKLDNVVFTAVALLAELQDADRREVEAVIGQYHLDKTQAADILAARAYVWVLFQGPRAFYNLPWNDKKTAEAVMRYEQDHPGTLGLAAHGIASAIASIDSLIQESTAGVIGDPNSIVTERTSVFPALSTHSRRARALVSNTPLQAWQAHHLIPFMVMDRLPMNVRAAIAASKWTMDSIENVIALPSNLAAFIGPPNRGKLPMHSSSHIDYDADVSGLLAPIAAAAVTMPPDDLRKALSAIEVFMAGQLRAGRYHPRVH